MKVFLFFLILSFPYLLWSQSTVSGKVVSNQEILPGVRVSITTLNIQTLTDFDGRFVFSKVPSGKHTLTFNYLGFEEQKIEIEVSESILEVPVVRMKEIVVQELSTVTVTAKMREGEAKAINMTKMAIRSVTVVSSEGVAKLPDRNAAEALSRLPGAVMESDQGEGRYVSFRGTPNDWSAALVNNDRMPVADEDSKTRAMKFDIFPTSLIDYVVVSKNLTPDLEGDAIGGSANFITRSAPNDSLLQINVGLGYNNKSAEPVYNLSLVYGDRSKNKKFGYLIGGSYYNRNWATDNYQIFYGTNFNHSILRLELRDYAGNRTTTGANLALDYRLNERNKIELKGTFGQMLDNEYNRKIQFNYGTGVGQSIRLQNIHNIMDTKFYGVELNGDHLTQKGMKMKWRLASYDNRFQYGKSPFNDRNDVRNGYYVIEFEKQVRYTDMLYLDEFGQATNEFNAVEKWKFLDIDSPVAGYGDNYQQLRPTWNNIIPFTPTDTMFLFLRAYTETIKTRESDPLVFQFDGNKQLNSALHLSFGIKARHKIGERKTGLEIWDRNPAYPKPIVYNNLNPNFQQHNGGFLNELGRPYDNVLFPFLSDDGITDFIPGRGDSLVHRGFGPNTPYYAQFIGSSYRYSETVLASYFSTEWNINQNIKLHSGVRVEYTSPKVNADTVIEDLSNFTRYLLPVSAGKSYLSVLPMINFRWELKNNQLIRAAVTRSFRRPNFNEIKPGQPSIDYTNFDLVYGNAELKPSYSINSDLSYERYFGSLGLFSLGTFYKYVTDHIYTAFETANLDGTGVSNEFQVPGGIISKRFVNAPKAFIFGLEAVFNRKFDFLPGKFSDLGVNANYTWSMSGMTIPSRTKRQALPRHSPNLVNASLFYESKKIITRIAFNYKDPYLFELNLYAVQDPNTGEPIIVHQDNDYDVYVGKSLTLDYSFAYRITKHFSVYLELNNLTNTPFVLYRGRSDRPMKTEFYSFRGILGIKYEIR